ncbi:MAG TPA: polysaccharide deacetylase family protein [Solirubrobacterales bacterium]
MSRDERRLGRTRDAVFLGYHALVENGPAFLSMSPAVFERQLEFLGGKGYRSGSRADLEALAAGRRLGGRHAFLTFDDGFLDTYEVARPLLAARGFTGFVFVLPRHLDHGAALDWPEVAGEVRRHPEVMCSMTWKMAEELAGAGWEVGSHTLTHPKLPELSDGELASELGESRQIVAERLGRCDTLAYPFGAWDERVERAAAAAGYRFAFTLPIESQPSAGPLSIPRLTIDDRDTVARYRAKISLPGRLALFSQLRPLVRRLRRHEVYSNAG